MNEYLAKLHRLESSAEPLGAENTLVRQLPKLTEPSFVSFDSGPSRGFSGPEPIAKVDEANSAMRNRNTEARKSAYVGYCQNRQNPEQSGTAFPFADALDALERECPDYVEPDCWQQCIEDAQRFIATWGDKAAALGWTADELFGLHEPPAKPHPSYSRLSRYDCTGLIWNLQGRRVVALTDNTAAIQNPTTGNILTYRKNNKPAYGPLGDSLDDFIA